MTDQRLGPCSGVAACLVLAVAGGSAWAQEPLFSDRAREAALDFAHFNGMSGEFYYVEHMAGGAALFDFDRDGDLDVYLVQGHVLGSDKTLEDMIFPPLDSKPLIDRLFRNDLAIGVDGERRLRFVDVTEASGIRSAGFGVGVSAADIDNDGWPDLYVYNHGGNQMFHNNGDGTFTDITKATGTGDRRFSAAASFADFDRDGWLDLFVGNYVDWSLVTHRPCSSATGALDYCSPLAYDAQADRLYRNLGDGTFADVTAAAGIGADYGPALGVVSADFNADGLLDFYVANDQKPNQLWLNQGDGTFVDEALIGGCAVNAVGQPEASMGVIVGDFDGDSSEDLFVTHLSRETNTLYLNDGSGLFRDATKNSGLGMPSFAYTGFGTVPLDYDSDGWLDIFVANGAVIRIESLAREGDAYPMHQTNQLFRNLEGRGFEVVDITGQPFLNTSEVSRGAAVGDIDNDGDPDLLVFNNSGPVQVLINNQAGPTRWTGLDLRMGWSGRTALSARVGFFREEGGTIRRRVRSDGGYASSHDPRLLVGFRGGAAADRVRVDWPSGGAVEWHSPPEGRYLVGSETSGPHSE